MADPTKWLQDDRSKDSKQRLASYIYVTEIKHNCTVRKMLRN